MRSCRDMTLAAVATTMVLFGFWIVLGSAGWMGQPLWLPPLLSISSACMLLIVLLVQRRWQRISPPPSTSSTRNRHQPPPNREMRDVTVVQLARLRYEITDAEEPLLFGAFLDQPLLIKPSAQQAPGYDTPGQVIENAILAYVKQLETTFNDQVTTNVNITRGSLTISLAFLSAYGFISQYHDFVESLALLRQQTQGLLREVNNWYRTQNGRQLQIRSNIDITSPAAAREPGKALQEGDSAAHPAQPFQINATVTPAANDIRIHVANSSFVNGLLAVLLVTSIFAQLLMGVIYFACEGGATAADCTDLVGQIMQWITYFARKMPAFFGINKL